MEPRQSDVPALHLAADAADEVQEIVTNTQIPYVLGLAPLGRYGIGSWRLTGNSFIARDSDDDNDSALGDDAR